MDIKELIQQATEQAAKNNAFSSITGQIDTLKKAIALYGIAFIISLILNIIMLIMLIMR